MRAPKQFDLQFLGLCRFDFADVGARRTTPSLMGVFETSCGEFNHIFLCHPLDALGRGSARSITPEQRQEYRWFFDAVSEASSNKTNLGPVYRNARQAGLALKGIKGQDVIAANVTAPSGLVLSQETAVCALQQV